MRLKIDNAFASPQRFDWSEIGNLRDLVVIPEVSLSDLQAYSFSPDELRDAGHGVPDDEGEAFAYALSAFQSSEEAEDWNNGFIPVMSVLWPCSFASPEQAAAAFRREMLACTVIRGEAHGAEISGIALTGGGMDLSDHLAAAYILCGQVPPVSVMEAALRKPAPRMEAELVEAGETLAALLQTKSAQMSEMLAERPGRGPRP